MGSDWEKWKEREKKKRFEIDLVKLTNLVKYLGKDSERAMVRGLPTEKLMVTLTWKVTETSWETNSD